MFAILVVGCACLVAGPAVADPVHVENVIETSSALEPFRDEHVGYDLRNDFFYFDHDKADNVYKVGNFRSTKLTLAGLSEDITERTLAKAVNPFVVGQTTKNLFGTIKDRWDVKENKRGHQFVALYHGHGGTFVVNKLRANLLRLVANQVQNSLLYLDTADAETGLKMKNEITRIIKSVFTDYDESLRESMKRNNDEFAHATIAIVSQKYLIVANAGQNSGVASNSLFKDSDLVSSNVLDETPGVVAATNVFGNRKGKSRSVVPSVAFFERFPTGAEAGLDEEDLEDDEEDEDDQIDDRNRPELLFFVLGTPSVAKACNDQTLVASMRSSANQFKSDVRHEAEMYSQTARNVLDMTRKRLNGFDQLANLDASVVVVGLSRDYTKFH